MSIELYPEFLTIATLHLFAVMSPGPDFALIIRQSFCYDRKISIITSIGIGIGILLHISLCITGISIIISKSIYLFNIIKISGGLYLIFLGLKSLLKKPPANLEGRLEPPKDKPNKVNAFSEGLFTNILNPKATLFFLSLYSSF